MDSANLPTYSRENADMELAERATVIAVMANNEGYKLSGGGVIDHYNAIATPAIESFVQFPLDFDWEGHTMDRQGDCWDVEITE